MKGYCLPAINYLFFSSKNIILKEKHRQAEQRNKVRIKCWGDKLPGQKLKYKNGPLVFEKFCTIKRTKV